MRKLLAVLLLLIATTANAYVVYDTFTGSAGVYIENHTPDTAPGGSSWHDSGTGIWRLMGSGTLGYYTGGTCPAPYFDECYINAGIYTNCYVKATASTNLANNGVCFHMQDCSNGWFVQNDKGDVYAVATFEIIAGSTYQRAGYGSPSGSLPNGDSFAVYLTGTSQTVYYGNPAVPIYQYFSADYDTQTQYGFHGFTYTGGEQWSNFIVDNSSAPSTPTYTPTSTATYTFTYTYTATSTPTIPTATSTVTGSRTYTVTGSQTYTVTGSQTYTPTVTGSRTPTLTVTGSITNTPTVTGSQTYTATVTGSRTYTATSTPTFTITRTATQTATATLTPAGCGNVSVSENFQKPNQTGWGTAQTGQFWYYVLSPLSILSNKGYLPTGLGNGDEWINSFISDGDLSVYVTDRTGTGEEVNLACRTQAGQEGNYGIYFDADITYQVWENTSTGFPINMYDSPVLVTPGDKMEIIYKGTDVKCLVNGVILYEFQDTWLTSNTIIGLYMDGSNLMTVKNFLLISFNNCTVTPTYTCTPTPFLSRTATPTPSPTKTGTPTMTPVIIPIYTETATPTSIPTCSAWWVMINDYNSCRNPSNGVGVAKILNPSKGLFTFNHSTFPPLADGGCIASILSYGTGCDFDQTTGTNNNWILYSSLNFNYESNSTMAFGVTLVGYAGYQGYYGPITSSTTWQCISIPLIAFTIPPVVNMYFYSNVTDVIFEPSSAGILYLDNISLTR